MNEDEAGLIRQLIENLDLFRETAIETFNVLHAKTKQNADRLATLAADIHAIRLIVWGILAILGVIVLILVIATIASLVRGS